MEFVWKCFRIDGLTFSYLESTLGHFLALYTLPTLEKVEITIRGEIQIIVFYESHQVWNLRFPTFWQKKELIHILWDAGLAHVCGHCVWKEKNGSDH